MGNDRESKETIISVFFIAFEDPTSFNYNYSLISS